MTRRVLVVSGAALVLGCALLLWYQQSDRPVQFSREAYVTFHSGLFEAPEVREEIRGLPEGVRCEVISEDHGDAARGFQIVLHDGNSMNQVLRPSDEAETVLLIGKRGHLRVKPLEWVEHDTQSRTARAVRLQFDYKFPAEPPPAP